MQILKGLVKKYAWNSFAQHLHGMQSFLSCQMNISFRNAVDIRMRVNDTTQTFFSQQMQHGIRWTIRVVCRRHPGKNRKKRYSGWKLCNLVDSFIPVFRKLIFRCIDKIQVFVKICVTIRENDQCGFNLRLLIQLRKCCQHHFQMFLYWISFSHDIMNTSLFSLLFAAKGQSLNRPQHQLPSSLYAWWFLLRWAFWVTLIWTIVSILNCKE